MVASTIANKIVVAFPACMVDLTSHKLSIYEIGASYIFSREINSIPREKFYSAWSFYEPLMDLDLMV